jgi:hypothetical protein
VRKVVIGVSAAIVALGLTAVAFAGSGSALLAQYGGLAGETQNKVAPASKGVLASAAPGGTLPFTGLDLALIAAGALVLMLTGWTLRRVAQKQRS